MLYLDIHTHRDYKDEGVLSIQSISPGHDLVDLSNPKLFSVGLHPWFSTIEGLDTQLPTLEETAAKTNVKLIGECGLDRLRGENMENQLRILEKQITIAEKLNKPLILHCVKAFSELIEIKDRLKVKVPMIIHGFNKNEELGKQLIAKGFLLSFGTGVLNPNWGAAKLITSFDNFYLETDDAELKIEEIYKAVANLKKCSVDELKALIFTNWKKLNLI